MENIKQRPQLLHFVITSLVIIHIQYFIASLKVLPQHDYMCSLHAICGRIIPKWILVKMGTEM
jgi:hypothetical protein